MGDQIDVTLEADGSDASVYADAVQDMLKLRANVSVVGPGDLPRDGILVSDLREPVS